MSKQHNFLYHIPHRMSVFFLSVLFFPVFVLLAVLLLQLRLDFSSMNAMMICHQECRASEIHTVYCLMIRGLQFKIHFYVPLQYYYDEIILPHPFQFWVRQQYFASPFEHVPVLKVENNCYELTIMSFGLFICAVQKLQLIISLFSWCRIV